MVAQFIAARPLDEEGTEHRRLVLATSVVVMVGTALYVVLMQLAGSGSELLRIVHGVLLLIGGAGCWLALRGLTGIAARLLCTAVFVAVAIGASPVAGSVEASNVTYVIPIVAAGLLIGRGAVLLAGGAMLATTSALVLLTPLRWTVATTSTTLVLIVAAGLIWLIIHRLERTLVQVRQQRAAALAAQAAHAAEAEAAQTSNAELVQANAQMSALLDLVRELETPAIPLLEGVLVLPLVGHIDTRRATRLSETALQAVYDKKARIVLLDITGVTVVDTAVAQRIIKLASAIKLLGAKVLLTGIRAEIAQTVVAQGIDFSGIETAGRLQDGIAKVLQRMEARVAEPLANGHRN